MIFCVFLPELDTTGRHPVRGKNRMSLFIMVLFYLFICLMDYTAVQQLVAKSASQDYRDTNLLQRMG